MDASYKADHIGSFLRPSELLQARSNGTTKEQLHALEDQQILELLDKQREAGIGIFTDGELRRRNFMSDFTDAVAGFDMGDAIQRSWDNKTSAPVASVTGIVTSKLKQIRPLTGEEVPFLRAHSPGPIKVTLPSATQFPAISFKRGVTDKIYPDHSALLRDVTEITRGEVQRLGEASVDYIQIDAPRYSYFMDPKWRDWIRTEMQQEPDAVLTEYVEADNSCFRAARNSGATLAIHLCRGNNRSHWYAQGGYDAIAEQLFGTLDVDRFLLEYDDERSGTFAPLRFVPKGKTVVLGLVSSKQPKLEDAAVLRQRIDEATKYIPLDNLAVSPQCGFASTMEGNLLSENDQWAKMRLVVNTAREVWGLEEV